MTPDPRKTKLELAEEFERDAQKSFRKDDLVFAKELSDHAHKLRMEYEQERKSELRPSL